MPTQRLTSPQEIVCPPDRSEITVWDQSLPGFGLRVRRSGVKRWICQFEGHGKQGKVTIGSVDLFTYDAAKRIARQTLAKARLGKDPAQERAEAKAAARLTLASVIKPYLAEQERKGRRRSTLLDKRRYLTGFWKPLHSTPIAQIKRADVAAVLAGRPAVAAARALSQLSALFSYAMSAGMLEVNVTIGMQKPDAHVKPRERVLSNDDLAAVWMTVDGEFAAVIRLLILTGCRRSEIGDLRWDEITDQAIIIPASRAKNGRQHSIPLTTAMRRILDGIPHRAGVAALFGRRGYRGWTVAKARLDRRLPDLKPWHIHDLRRSFASGLGDLSVQPHVIESLLNHQTFKRGVAGTYNRSLYENEKRVALNMWSDHIAALTGGERKVIPISAHDKA